MIWKCLPEDRALLRLILGFPLATSFTLPYTQTPNSVLVHFKHSVNSGANGIGLDWKYFIKYTKISVMQYFSECLRVSFWKSG